MHSLLTYFPSINIVQDLPFKTPAFVCPMKNVVAALCFALMLPLSLAAQNPSGYDSSDAERNELSKDALTPKERCNRIMADNEMWGNEIQEAVKATSQLLVAKHAVYWASNAEEQTGALSKEDEAQLTADLNNLLDLAWQIEMHVVRGLYKGPEHTRPFHHLKVSLDPEADLGAWACSDKDTIQVSTLLIRKLWANAIHEQIKERFELEIDSESKLFATMGMPEPPDVTYQQFLDQTEAVAARENYYSVKLAAYGVVRMATIDYVKALLFLLSHEAAHLWLDRCPSNGVSIYRETRADDYGLLISSSWLGEQFNFATQQADAANLRTKLIKQAKENREDARKRLKVNHYPPEPGFSFSPEKFSDEQTANESDAAIERRIYKDVPGDSANDIFSLGRQGFETFVDVYEKVGMKEYLEGNTTHPPMEVRLKRLKYGYKSENFVGKQILLNRLGTERELQKLVQKQSDERAAKMIEPLVMMLAPDITKSYPECETLH